LPNFVEQATLMVKDQSTPQIKKINAALKQLQSTANSLKSMKVNLTGITKASGEVRKLTNDLNRLKASSISLKVNTGSLSAAGRQLATLRSQARRPISASFTGGFAAGAVTGAAGRTIREGTKTVDIGETSLALKELPADIESAVQKSIDEIAKGQKIFNRGTVTQQVSEMLGVVKIGAATGAADATERVKTAQFLAKQNLALAETFVKLGQDVDTAQEEAIKFGKALDMQSKIYDKATGNLDVAEATKQYDMIRKLIPAIGKEATGSNFLQLMKYLRVSKFGLSEESTALAMSDFEKMGTTAAVGLNQMIKTLRGETTKQGIAEQVRLGLLTPEEVASGTVGGKKSTTRKGVLDEERSKKLYEHPTRFINEDLIPAWKKDLMTRKKLTEAQAEAELFKPAVVADLVSKLGGTATSRDVLTNLVLQRKENSQFLRDFNSRSGSLAEQQRRTALSIIGATTALSQQTQGLAGEAARALAPVMVPALGFMSDTLRDLAPVIRDAEAGDKGAMAKLGIGAAGAVAGVGIFGALTKKLSNPVTKAVTDGLSTLAQPLGLAAGISGMTSRNPAVSSLSSAGVALIGAASALKEAAADLSGKTPPLGPLDLPGGEKGGKGTGKSTIPKGMGKSLMIGGAVVGGYVGVTAAVIGAIQEYMDQHPPGQDPTTRKLIQDYDQRMKEQGVEELRSYQGRLERTIPKMKPGRKKTAALGELARVKKEADSLTAQLTAAAVAAGKITLPSWVVPPQPGETTPKPGEPKPGEPKIGEPTEKPFWLKTVTDAPNAFEQTFNTLPQKGAEAGTSLGNQAMTAMQGGAQGIGNVIANAAVAGIKAGVSNLNITVNAKVGSVDGGGDKGASKAD